MYRRPRLLASVLSGVLAACGSGDGSEPAPPGPIGPPMVERFSASSGMVESGETVELS
jgi:hypothetical protein